MNKFMTSLLLAIFLMGASFSASAQNFNFGRSTGQDETLEKAPKVINPYADKYKSDVALQSKSKGPSLLPNSGYEVKLIRKLDAPPDDLNFLISLPGAVAGCMHMSKPYLKWINMGRTLRLNIEGESGVHVDKSAPRTFQHECKSETGSAQIRFRLSKQELQKDKINKLEIASVDLGPFYTMKLAFHERSLTIESKRPSGQSETFTYWTYPENTLVLFAPALDLHDPALIESVRKLALHRGLIPLDTVLHGFKPQPENTDKLYVVDDKGIFRNALTSPNDIAPLGTAQTTQRYFGPNGPYDKPVQKTVYARFPRSHE